MSSFKNMLTVNIDLKHKCGDAAENISASYYQIYLCSFCAEQLLIMIICLFDDYHTSLRRSVSPDRIAHDFKTIMRQFKDSSSLRQK